MLLFYYLHECNLIEDILRTTVCSFQWPRSALSNKGNIIDFGIQIDFLLFTESVLARRFMLKPMVQIESACSVSGNFFHKFIT